MKKSLISCECVRSEHFPFLLGEKIGDGIDGEVFDLQGIPNQVIKLVINSPLNDYNKIHHILDYMIGSLPDAYVHVHKHGHFDTAKTQQVVYYYVMDKLYPITEDEGRVFHTILSHENRGITKDLSINKIDNSLRGLSRGLDFDVARIKLFISNIVSSTLIHLDLAPRNILKDQNGDFKLIDLDRVEFKNRRK